MTTNNEDEFKKALEFFGFNEQQSEAFKIFNKIATVQINTVMIAMYSFYDNIVQEILPEEIEKINLLKSETKKNKEFNEKLYKEAFDALKSLDKNMQISVLDSIRISNSIIAKTLEQF